MSEHKISVSVRSLIEYSLKSGSIDYQYQGAMRAVEGVIFHQKMQKKRESQALIEGGKYEREVSFKENFSAHGIDIEVRGRADGILHKDGEIFVEEIKTTTKPLENVSDSELHIAQAKCYAYFYMKNNEMPEIGVMLTYINVTTFESKEYFYNFTLVELEIFFDKIISDYAAWAKFILDWRTTRDGSISELTFPFESYRDGQREMSVAVYRTIERRKKIFVSAPTGIGKTISSLFPAVKAIERKKAEKIFYLTAKTITRTAALDAARLLENGGLQIKAVVLTAKDKICFKDERICDPQYCEYANGHLDRINAALADILKIENIITKETILEYAKKHAVCSYELSLDIASFSDIVICDYNYAFDPRVYLRRFFTEAVDPYVFLIDEAHNLVDRAREMYSATLDLKELKAASKEIKKEGRELKQLVSQICSELEKMSSKIDDEDYGLIFEDVPTEIYNHTKNYLQTADKWLEKHKNSELINYYDTVLDLYFLFMHFLNMAQIYDEKFICYCQKERRDVIFKIFCIDPSSRLSTMLENAASSVFFSATLTPLKYFMDLLGGEETDYAITMKSPFPKENLLVSAAVNISTRYRHRADNYENICDYINTFVSAKKGNYFVFFPSYAFLENVLAIFEDKYTDIQVVSQTPDISEEQKEQFLLNFEPQTERSFAAFAVLGGMFSEGIDLPGERLIGAIVVSVGLPKVSFERTLIQNHFSQKSMNGFEYSYMYPGMNKVLQAAGRVIRTMWDRGVVLLIDDRFSDLSYSSLFPKSWNGFIKVRSPGELSEHLSEKWNKWHE